MLNGNIHIADGQRTPQQPPPITAEFKIQQYTVSGIKVANLIVTREQYKPYKGVRSVTKAGRFQIRA